MQQEHREQRNSFPTRSTVALAASMLVALAFLVAATSSPPHPQLTQAVQDVTTATAVAEGWISDVTTLTGRVQEPSGSLLDRLTRNKPGIWGNKLFYVGLGGAYIALLILFFRTILRQGKVRAAETATEDKGS